MTHMESLVHNYPRNPRWPQQQSVTSQEEALLIDLFGHLNHKKITKYQFSDPN